jgi:hypothetical protein
VFLACHEPSPSRTDRVIWMSHFRGPKLP